VRELETSDQALLFQIGQGPLPGQFGRAFESGQGLREILETLFPANILGHHRSQDAKVVFPDASIGRRGQDRRERRPPIGRLLLDGWTVSIADNHPKLVVSMDPMSQDDRGVKHLGLRTFLRDGW
jgi:hypothetical protein